MNVLVTSGQFDPGAATTSVELSPGQVVTLPTAMLLDAIGFEQRLSAAGTTGSGAGIGATGVIATGVVATGFDASGQGATVIPVIAEELVVTKRVVPMETVRLVTNTELVAEKVDVDLTRERWEITRVPVDAEVSERSDLRQEGDLSIYPVFEERLLTRTALFLIEEIHVRKIVEIKRETLEAEVRREVLSVERTQF